VSGTNIYKVAMRHHDYQQINVAKWGVEWGKAID
jgi:hypothetical protein